MEYMTKTTLTAAVTATADVISVASATGFSVNKVIKIDKEFAIVKSVSGTDITLTRGTIPGLVTAHVSGSLVYVADANDFVGSEKAAYDASAPLTPAIDINTGDVFHNVNGVWVKQERGPIGAATNYGLSPAIWNDCPLEKMLIDPGYGHFDGDDFAGASGSPFVTAHKYELAGANGTFAAVAGAPGGAGIISAPGTDNDEATLMANNDAAGLIKADAASNWWFEARIKVSTATVEVGAFVGLAEETGIGTDFFTDDTMALKVVDYLGFQVIHATAAANVWQTVMALNGGAHVVISAAAVAAGTSYVKLGMKSVAGSVTFYVNGVPLATGVLSSATNFPLDQVMGVLFGVKTGKAAAYTMTIDWWKAAQTRLAN
jgi:hypothetical protein